MVKITVSPTFRISRLHELLPFTCQLVFANLNSDARTIRWRKSSRCHFRFFLSTVNKRHFICVTHHCNKAAAFLLPPKMWFCAIAGLKKKKTVMDITPKISPKSKFHTWINWSSDVSPSWVVFVWFSWQLNRALTVLLYETTDSDYFRTSYATKFMHPNKGMLFKF